MWQQNKRGNTVLFKIDVKIGERIVTLNVQRGDTIISLLEKHQIEYSDPKRFDYLRSKIIENIQKQIQIKTYSNQLDLADKMKAFIQKENISQKNSQQKNQNVNARNKSFAQVQTPFKLLFERTDKFQNRHQVDSSFQIKKQNIAVQNHSKSYIQSKSPLKQDKKLNNKSPLVHYKHVQMIDDKKPSYSKYSLSQKKVLNRKVDNDLIMAYEVILKKSKDKVMREMAQKTLKQLNVNKKQQNTGQFFSFDQSNQQNKKIAEQKNQMHELKILSDKKNINQNVIEEQSSNSQSFTRKAYKYSYLPQKSQNINLTYVYEDGDKQNERRQYKYTDDLENSIPSLNKFYMGEQRKIFTQNEIGFNNKRFTYLVD